MAWCHQATSHYPSQCWPRCHMTLLGHNELKMTFSWLLPTDYWKTPYQNCQVHYQGLQNMMTSSNGNIFCVIGPLCSLVNSLHKGQWHGALMFSLICAWINSWVNNHEPGDLRRHCAHYDVTIMYHTSQMLVEPPYPFLVQTSIMSTAFLWNSAWGELLAYPLICLYHVLIPVKPWASIGRIWLV